MLNFVVAKKNARKQWNLHAHKSRYFFLNLYLLYKYF